MDIATLGLRVDGAGAINTVKQFGDAAEKAGQQTDALGTKTAPLGGHYEKLSRSVYASAYAMDAHLKSLKASVSVYDNLNRSIIANAYAMDAARNTTIASTRGMGALSALNAEATGHVGAHTLAYGRLERALASFSSEALGVNRTLEVVGTSLSHFAVGSVALAGVLGGIALVIGIFEKLTEGMRKTKEAADKVSESLEKAAHARALGATAAQQDNAKTLQKMIDLDKEAIRDHQPSLLKKALSPEDAALSAIIVAQAKADLVKRVADLRENNAQIKDITSKGAEDTRNALNSDLAARISHGQATAKQRADALALLKAYQHDVAELDKSGKLHEAMALQGEVDKLQGALFPKAGRGAGTRSNELEKEITLMEKRARLAGEFAKQEDDRTARLAHGIADVIRENAAASKVALGLDSSEEMRAAIRNNVSEGLKGLFAEEAEVAHRTKEMLREIQRDFATFFYDIFTKGIHSFQDLFTSIKNMFLKLIAEMLAANFVKKISGAVTGILGGLLGSLAPSVLAAQGSAPGLAPTIGKGAYAGSALAGFGVGYGAGSLAGSAGGGAVLGGLSGAATGFAIAGPVGAVIGGLTGLVGGLLSGAKAAREHAEALKVARETFARNLASFDAQARGTNTPLSDAIAQKQAEAQQLRDQAKAANPGQPGPWGRLDYSARQAAIDHINESEKLYIERLQKEDALKRADYNKTLTEDLRVRLLRAQGRDKEADTLALQIQQQREYAAAVAAGADATTLLFLKTVQAAEKVKQVVDSLTTSVRNAPSGFKVESYINSFAEARKSYGSGAIGGGWETGLGVPPIVVGSNPNSPNSPNSPKGGGGGTTVNMPNATFSFMVPPDASPEKVGKGFMIFLRRVASTTVGPNVPLGSALDYA